MFIVTYHYSKDSSYNRGVDTYPPRQLQSIGIDGTYQEFLSTFLITHLLWLGLRDLPLIGDHLYSQCYLGIDRWGCWSWKHDAGRHFSMYLFK